MDWLKRLFNDPATVVVLASSGLVGLIVGIANGVVQKRHGGWAGFFSALFTGIVIALIVGLATKDYITSETLRLAIIGACAVISDDIWAGLKALGMGVRTDPIGTVMRLFDALRARSSTPPAPANPDTPKE